MRPVLARAVAAVLPAVLVTTLSQLPMFPKAAAAAPATKPACPSEGRPDRVAASVAARLCGDRVEVTGELSETTRVWAEPNGSLSAERALGMTRFRRDGKWVDVDLTLVRNADGSVSPKAHPNGLRLSGSAGSGSHDVASVNVSGGAMSMVWNGALPLPVLSGTRATYPSVFPDVDLVVEATASGFEQLLIVKSAAGVASVARVRLGLKLNGRGATLDGAGGLLFKNAVGDVVGRTPAPVMWDSAEDQQGQPAPASRVVGLVLGAPRVAGAAHDVTLTPDAAWLADSARRFPITIDPYVVPVAAGFDTYTQSNIGYDLSSSTELRIGTQNSGGVVARSYVNLNASGLSGSKINWATLKLWQSGGVCSGGGWELWRTRWNASASTRWSNQPPLDAYISTSTQSVCGGWVEIEAKDYYQYAADRNWGEFTAGLKAYWEDTNSFFKIFKSKESGTIPHVSLNWNEPPVVSGPATVPATSGCVTGASRPWMSSLTPRLAATVSDSDGAASDMVFEVAVTGNPAPIAVYTKSGVASGTAGTADVAAGVLQENGTYSWHVMAKDPSGWPASAWSQWCEFTVDSRNPGVPWVSSAEFPENGRATVGTGTFMFTQASTAQDGNPENGVMASYSYQLDGAASPTVVNADASGNATMTLSNVGDGYRSLTVIAKDKAGNASNPKVYNFAVGRAGVSMPLPGAAVPKSVKIALEIPDTTLTRATLKYRRGPGGAEYPIPLSNLHKADMSPVTTSPVPWTSGQYLIWDATDTLGALGGVAEIRADVFPTADGQPAYQTAWVRVNVDPNGDNAAAANVGPGQLNLLTGDHTLSANDIDEVGLSVSRTASSRVTADGWLPQGERLAPAQQQITDITGFSTVPCAQPGLGRSTAGGQSGSIDALAITVQNCGSDSYATVGGSEAFRQNMKPGRKYKLTAWIYVTSTVGLNPGWYGWGQSAMGITTGPTSGTTRFYSGGARFVDAWQELTVIMDVPLDATSAEFRLWNAGNIGATVYFDNISVKELIAPFGPQWRGGVTDPISGSEYISITLPDNDSAAVNLAAGGQISFGKSANGEYFPAPGAESLSLKKNGNNFELSELDGTITEFVAQSATTFIVNGSWDTSIAKGSGTRFVYDNSDYRTVVKRVISPTEPGVETSTVHCTDSVPAKGCEVLEYEYATLTTARGADAAKPWEFGDFRDQVRAVKLWSWDPAAGAVTSVEVSRYLYDNKGQLRQVFDPRVGPGNTNLALNKTATGSAACSAGETPDKAVNGTVNGGLSDKWCSLTGPRWLQVDLGAVKTLNSFGIDHAETGGENAAFNTKDYDIQVSSDATNWTTVVVVQGNTDKTTTHWTAPISGRYVRLNVTTPTQATDPAARIYEFRVNGHDGATERLTTIYDYDNAGHITTITPAGQLPWMFDYGTIGTDPNTGRLHRVRRASLVQGSKTQTGPENVTRIVYNVPTTRGAGGPFDMDAGTISTWGQSDVPTSAMAIFGPEDDPLTVNASVTTPGPDGYKYATVHYLNANAQEVNTATPSAAGVPSGNIDTTQYDKFGNVIWELEATNRLIALGAHPQAAEVLGKLNLSQLDTKNRAYQLGTDSVYSADGKDLLSKTGPALTAVLENAFGGYAAGATVTGRARTTYTYDENKPDGAEYHLVTTEVNGLVIGAEPNMADARTTVTGYAPINASHSGWILRKATQVTADAGSGGANLNAYTVYDSSGRTLKSWGVGQSAAKGAKQTIYYAAGSNSGDPACDNAPQWAGQPCLTLTVAENLPVRKVESYNRYGDAELVTESNAGKTRSTTTTFDTAGRVKDVEVTSSDGTTPLAKTTTVYDVATGQPVQTAAGGISITHEYDRLGRLVKYTDADGGVTTSEYDRYGRPAKTVDPTGTITYGYDRAIEPRGMLTSLTDNNAGTFTARYSPDGQLTTVGYPGGITRTDTLDANLQPIAREYKRDSDGVKLYAESVEENAHGQWAKHAYTGGFKTFGYDRLGRLRTAMQDYNGQCTQRSYEFAGIEGDRTNRTAKKTWLPGPGGGCADTAATPDQTINYTYDSVDRLLTDSTGGYTYDEFGRTTAMPSGLVNTFHSNDMVASQTLGINRQTWTLDPAQRLRTFTTETQSGGTWGSAVNKVNHYSGDSDSPKWITENTATGNWTRNVAGPDGDLAVTVTQGGVKTLAAVNLHGDTVFTLNVATPGGAPDAYYDYDEFGNPTTGNAGRYGWLGGKQRSSEAVDGVVLMGVRLYSPSLGRFLQVDPVDGGSCNAYDYVCADPINEFDLDGKSLWSKIKKAAAVVAPIASFAAIIPGPIGTAAALVSAGAYALSGNYKMAGLMAGTAALAMVGAGAAGVAAGIAVRGATKLPQLAKVGTRVASVFRSTRVGPITYPSRASQAVDRAFLKVGGAAVLVGRGVKAISKLPGRFSKRVDAFGLKHPRFGAAMMTAITWANHGSKIGGKIGQFIPKIGKEAGAGAGAVLGGIAGFARGWIRGW